MKKKLWRWVQQQEIEKLKSEIREEESRLRGTRGEVGCGGGLGGNNPTLLRNHRLHPAHARTQSELPANVIFRPVSLITSTKKGFLGKGESPLSEKADDHSEHSEDDGHPLPNVESGASGNSNHRSKHSSRQSHPSQVLHTRKSSKVINRQSRPQTDALNAISDQISRVEHTDPQSSSQNSKTTPAKGSSPPEPESLPNPLESKTEQKLMNSELPRDTPNILKNQNIIFGHVGQMNIFPLSAKKETPLAQFPVGLGPEEARTQDLPLQKHSLDRRHQRDSSNQNVEVFKTAPPAKQDRWAESGLAAFLREGNLAPQLNTTTRRFLTARELTELNADLLSQSRVHVWQKIDCVDLNHPFELFNMTPKKSLTLADSKPAHLDVIRRLEFVENQRKELLALTFSEDATIRTWRVTYSTSDSQAGEAVNVSKTRLTVPDLPGPLHFKPGLATHETKEWRPPNFQEKPSRKQLGRAASFLNLETSKNPIAKLKRGVIVRAHPRAIFSSCVSRFQNAPVRVFSGDQSGTINCYEVESDGLDRIKSFKAGSEPVWALDALDADSLVASSPNKLKMFSVSRSTDYRGELLFENKSGLFGNLKALTATSFIVNSYSTATLDSEFVLYDAEGQREVSRIPSSQKFCNSMAVIPNLSMLLSANEDKTVSVFDTREGCQTNHFNAHSDAVTAIDVCPDKNLFVTAGADSTVRLWDLRSLRIHNVIHAHRRKHDDSIFDVRFDAAARLIGSAGADGALKIFHF